MESKLVTEIIDKLVSLSKEELDNIFSLLSLSEIEDLMSKLKEEVE
jgi:hypothetical protein